MIDGNHGNLIHIYAIKDVAGKAPDDDAAHAGVNLRGPFWGAGDVVKSRLHAKDELVA